MKIAIIGSRHLLSRYSGIETGLMQVLPRLAALGHQVTIFANDSQDGAANEYQGVRLVPVTCVPGKYTETLTRSAFALSKAIFRGYDVIHFQHQGPGIFSPATRALGVPTVVSVHGLDWRRQKWGGLAKLCIRTAERAAVHFGDRIVVVSRQLQQYFADMYGLEAAYIPNGLSIRPRPKTIDPLEQFGLRPDRYVLFAARLVPEKGCHDLIEAWNQLETDSKLVVAGAARYDLPYARRLRAAADPDKVVFTGHVEGSAFDAILANAYLAVLPSYIEGYSVFLLEALSYGRCILTSDIPENLEVIGDFGFSFPVGNVAALRGSLERLLTNPAVVQDMRDRVVDAARGMYSWDESARRHEEVYLSAVGGAVGTPISVP